MILKPVEYLPCPERTNCYEKLGEVFDWFMNMDVKYAQVFFDNTEYATETSCRGSLHSYIYRHPDLPVKASVINGEVYLIRTDKED